jgi:excinuclease UvrABC nuclease subunit
MKAIKTKFKPAYININGKLKTNFDILKKDKKQAGVYLIKSNQSGNIVYIGFSATNIYRTLYRHFQNWNDTKQNRYIYGKITHTVRVILTTPTRAAILEKYLILKYFPRDNKDKAAIHQTRAEFLTAEDIINNTEFLGGQRNSPF